ncbi:glutathione S-transferase family protein [Aspergillus clavatus NRRL 1]|uniref:Glutathione S-transferase, putative n=1 Tax=Aspergillus clavatus (strain ATCC 1007 / CBS 513.65 / DSM 816 / NCTC 3887 / NRRL 1 / QM 1276 / 107) TaxID=344612 RepID=A1CFP7_ASPCL|nr:glutathione S-transferase, putative [Aspergillus clavatus NRRL 1]EAW11696.1 glutathione S-transferase, putative [Aspergillus clavatus NRRL 1]
MTVPKITLYTNHRCPWAHRAHIALKELGLDYEEVIIDLDTPREPWYLEINPRGLVPSITYNGEIVTESAIVAQFLADAHPSHLLPPSNTPEGALKRARIAFFVDTFFTKVQSHFIASLRASSENERTDAGEAFVAAIEKEIEPVLSSQTGSGPFFGGSEKLTLVEVLIGSFLLRILSFHKPETGLLRQDLPELLEKRTPAFTRWAKVTVAQESVNFIWNEKDVAEMMKQKLATLKK